MAHETHMRIRRKSAKWTRVVAAYSVYVRSTEDLGLEFPATSFTEHSTSPDWASLPAQHFQSSGFLCCRSNGLELATGQSPWPGARQQQLQTIAENEPISLLPLSTHSAVEMLHDSALYKSIIDTDNDITFTKFYRNKTTWQRTSNFSKSWQKTAHRDKDLLTETTYQLCWPLVTVE